MANQKVPVLLLPMSLGIGGAETHVVSLAKRLLARGWETYVASAGGQLVADLERAGVKHFHAPLDSRSPLSMLRARRVIEDVIRQERTGLVHAHARIPAWISEKICRRLDVPLVMTYHGTFASGPFWKAFTRPGDATVAVSSDIRDYIVREFGFPPGSIEVIPNGIDLDHFREPSWAETADARKALLPQDSSSPVVLYASRLDGDLAEVATSAIDACRGVLPRYPSLALLVVGDGDGLAAVGEHAARANREAGREFAHCTGYLPDTFPAYAASDLVIGMSRVALEAMACGRPVIIAGPEGVFGPVRQEIEDDLERRNYTSRSAPRPLSTQALSSHIEALLGDPVARHHSGQFGRKVIAERHSMDEVATKTEGVYRRLLSAYRWKG